MKITQETMACWCIIGNFKLFSSGIVEWKHKELMRDNDGELIDYNGKRVKNKSAAAKRFVITKLKLDGIGWPETKSAKGILNSMRIAYNEQISWREANK